MGVLVSYPDVVARPDFIEKLNDVTVAHQNTAAADRLANPLLVLGPVDIDIAVVGIDVAPGVDPRFQAAEPEDPAGDEAGRRAVGILDFREMLTRRHPVLENDSGRLARPYPFGNFMESARGPQGMRDIGRRPFGSGYDV
jgi:hypothetical protein